MTVPGQMLPFSVGSNGALQQQTGGAVPGDATLANPIYLVEESKSKWVYVAYQGNNNTTSGNTQSGIAGWVIDPTTHQLTPEIPAARGVREPVQRACLRILQTSSFIQPTSTTRR